MATLSAPPASHHPHRPTHKYRRLRIKRPHVRRPPLPRRRKSRKPRALIQHPAALKLSCIAPSPRPPHQHPVESLRITQPRIQLPQPNANPLFHHRQPQLVPLTLFSSSRVFRKSKIGASTVLSAANIRSIARARAFASTAPRPLTHGRDNTPLPPSALPSISRC